MPKKIKRKEGDVFQIALPTGDVAFGRVLPDPLCAFYDLKSKSIPSVDDILSAKVLFKIWVMNHALWYGRWPILGNRPLDDELKEAPRFSKIDPISKKLFIYCNGEEKPALRDQLERLERAAVWDPEHVESRLMDHFAGRPNIWVEKLKL